MISAPSRSYESSYSLAFDVMKSTELNQVCTRDDLVFARDGYALATKLRGMTEGIQATIFYWASSQDLVDLFRAHIICA
jgi:hypothetical protein